MDRDRTIARLTGCYIAIPTLFDDDLELNLAGMRRHVQFLLDGGVREGNGVLLTCGAAGDFSTLSIDERLRIAETVVEAAEGKVGVIVGAQSTSLREAVAIAKGAERRGATALQISPPFYHPPTDEDVYEYVKAITEAADIGVFLYTTHWMGYKVPLDLIGRMADWPQLVGLKWGAPTTYEYDKGLRLFADRLAVVDNQLLFVLTYMQGGRGINTHTSNYWPEWGVRLWSLLEEGKYVEAQQEITSGLMPYYDLVMEVARETGGEGHLDKLCLELVGLDSSRCRPPTRDIRPQFREKARQMLRQIGCPHLKIG
ncbi:4-hydroxy-tetrahydrodipicolinate synthase [soil metagenome]